MLSTRASMLVGFALLVAYAAGLMWGLPSEFPPAVDADLPYSPLSFLAELSDPDIANKYPAAHYLVTLPLYALAIGAALATGQVHGISSSWPYGFEDPIFMLSALIAISGFLTVLAAVGIILAVSRIRLPGLGRLGTVTAMLLLASSGVFTYYARSGNVDLPYVFWWSISLCALWRYLFDSGSRRSLLFAGALAAIAVATKDQAAGLVIGAAFVLLLVPRRRGAVVDVRAPALYSAAAVCVYAAIAVLPQPLRWASHLETWTFGPAVEYAEFDETLTGHIALAWETLVRLEHVVSLPALVLAGLGVLMLARQGHGRQLTALLLPLLVYHAIVINGVMYVQERFVLPLAIPAVLLAGLAVETLLAWAREHGRVALTAAGAGTAIVVLLQFGGGFVPMTLAHADDNKRRLARTLPEEVPVGSALLWLGQSGNVTNLPNADVYDRYDLVLPAGETPAFRSVEHVFKPHSGAPQFILSDSPRQFSGRGALIRRWRQPAWIKSRLHVPPQPEFHLYAMRPARFELATSASAGQRSIP